MHPVAQSGHSPRSSTPLSRSYTTLWLSRLCTTSFFAYSDSRWNSLSAIDSGAIAWWMSCVSAVTCSPAVCDPKYSDPKYTPKPVSSANAFDRASDGLRKKRSSV